MGDLTRTGIAIVGTAATVSLTATTSLLAYICVQCLGDLRAPKGAPRRSGGLQFVGSDVGIMYLSLLAGDTVQAIGFILSFHYLNGPPATPSSAFCSAQGAFIQSGDLSIALSTTLLALHTCYVRA